MSMREPIAFKSPNPFIKFRSVSQSDAVLLYEKQFIEKPLLDVHSYVKRSIKTIHQLRGDCVLVYDKTEDDIIGMGAVTYWQKCGEISDLYVIPSQRSKGIGTAIIQYLVSKIRQTPLQRAEIGVALSNTRALDLYRKLGFDDRKQVNLDVGNGVEPVLYLELSW